MYGHVQSYSVSTQHTPRKILAHQPQPLIDRLDQKNQRNQIHKVQSDPPVYQIATKKAAELCFRILRDCPNWHTGYVGFDTETTVYRRKDRQVVSMIQIATRELCFLFQVYKITDGHPDKFPNLLKEMLTNQDIKKVGVNASGDADWIKKSYNFEMQGVIDLERIAGQKGYAARSLAELTRMFGEAGLVLEKTKKILRWNFDAPDLDLEIVRYASSDAFAGIQIYENILKDKMNDEYLYYEERNPMSVKDEYDEVYSLISESHPKGKDISIKTVINYIENKYQRWTKTKPKTDDRRKAALGAIDRFIEDGRLVKVLNDNSDSNSDSEQNGKESSSIDNGFKIRLPGVSFNTVLKVYGKKFFESKGLSPQDSEFMEEISSLCLKAIKKESLAKIIVNNGKITSLNEKNHVTVTSKLNELSRKGALMPGQKWNTLLLHPDWLKELEDGYEEYRKTHAEDEHAEDKHAEDEHAEDKHAKDEHAKNEHAEGETSKEDNDSNKKNLEGNSCVWSEDDLNDWNKS